MSSPGSSELAGSLFGFTFMSLMFWLGVGFLPFSSQVSGWFRTRMESDAAVSALGGKAAAKNMSAGQIVLFAIASITMSSIILLNVGPFIGATLSANQVLAGSLLWGIFLGAAAVVGGIVLALLGRTRMREHARALVPTGVGVALVGAAGMVTGIAYLLSAIR